jgi:hypothetical protein
MKFEISTFVTDDGTDPVSMARAIEERGFDSLVIAERTHIPASRTTANTSTSIRHSVVRSRFSNRIPHLHWRRPRYHRQAGDPTRRGLDLQPAARGASE